MTAPAPNQPEGPGWYALLTKVYLAPYNTACQSYDVKTGPNGTSLGLSDYIIGHWRKLLE